MLGRLDEGDWFMAIAITRRAYRDVLTPVLVVVFSIGAFAQSKPVAARTSAPSVARDLNSTLAELMRVAPATNQDLGILQQQQHGARLHRVTFWRGDKAHNAETVEALRRNLQFAVPEFDSRCASFCWKHLDDFQAL